MRTAALLLALAGPLGWASPAQVAVKPPAAAPASAPVDKIHLGRAAFLPVERSFDEKLQRISVDDPVDLLGATRGLYLEGYGAVFTTELSLIVTPTLNPFRQVITPQEAERVYKRKLQRLPQVRQAMREMMVSAATALDSAPPNEQIVVVVRLLYLSWENTGGLPGQIVMKADRATLLRKATLDSAIQTEEY